MTLSVPRSSDLGGIVPRFVTPRDPSRRTMGPAVRRVAAARGRSHMPWQRYVADVGGEVDDRGLYVHRTCIVTVQRQAGKTTLKEDQAVQRAAQGPNRRCWDTAQTGQDARDKHRELADGLLASPLRDIIAGRNKAAGSERLTFTNGSTIRPHPPTRDALHGKQSDHNDIDEGWAFDEVRGAELLQAIEPTQATRPGAQTWVWSTRGDRSSVWFHTLIERALAGEPGFALFDFGIPDDVEPTDENMAAYHPAIGYTIDLDTIRRSSLPPGEKARAYGNRATGAAERIIPADAWEGSATDDVLPPGRPAYGVAVSEDGSMGALVAAVLDDNGVPWVEVIEHRPGRSWLADRVKGLRDAGQGVAILRNGPAAPVADALALAEVALLPVTTVDYAAACGDLFDRITDDDAPPIALRRHEGLDTAADVAGRKRLVEGGWIWSRTKSTGDIAPLEAATLAAWAVLRNPKPAPAPKFRFA